MAKSEKPAKKLDPKPNLVNSSLTSVLSGPNPVAPDSNGVYDVQYNRSLTVTGTDTLASDPITLNWYDSGGTKVLISSTTSGNTGSSPYSWTYTWAKNTLPTGDVTLQAVATGSSVPWLFNVQTPGGMRMASDSDPKLVIIVGWPKPIPIAAGITFEVIAFATDFRTNPFGAFAFGVANPDPTSPPFGLSRGKAISKPGFPGQVFEFTLPDWGKDVSYLMIEVSELPQPTQPPTLTPAIEFLPYVAKY